MPILGYSQVIPSIDAILCLTEIYENRDGMNQYNQLTIADKSNYYENTKEFKDLFEGNYLVFYVPELSLTQSYKRGIILMESAYPHLMMPTIENCYSSHELYEFMKNKRWILPEIFFNECNSNIRFRFKNRLFRPNEKYCTPAATEICKIKLYGELNFFKNCDIKVLNLDRQKKKEPQTIIYKDIPIYYFTKFDSFQCTPAKEIRQKYGSVKKRNLRLIEKEMYELSDCNLFPEKSTLLSTIKSRMEDKLYKKLRKNIINEWFRPQKTYLPMGKYFKD